MSNLIVINKQEVLGKQFKVYGSVEDPLFLAKDVAEYLENKNVSQMIKSADLDEDEKGIYTIDTPGGTQNLLFVTEDGLYELLMQSRKPIAKAFKKEVKTIMKQLRQTGVVITEAATDDSIDFEKKYGIYRIRKTFTNTINLVADYEEFKELAKANRVSGADRVKRLNIIGSSISNRLQENMAILKPSELMQMQELLTEIKSDTLKISNKTNGGHKAVLTKKLNKKDEYITEMQSYIDTIDPSSDEYICISTHSFTENCIYGSQDDSGDLRFSKAYNVWRHLFPKNQFPETTDVDFSKPVLIWMYFDHLEKFDVTNMSKSFLDMLCLNYKVDDHQINIMRCCTNNIVDDYSDGKIYYCIKNA